MSFCLYTNILYPKQTYWKLRFLYNVCEISFMMPVVLTRGRPVLWGCSPAGPTNPMNIDSYTCVCVCVCVFVHVCVCTMSVCVSCEHI